MSNWPQRVFYPPPHTYATVHSLNYHRLTYFVNTTNTDKYLFNFICIVHIKSAHDSYANIFKSISENFWLSFSALFQDFKVKYRNAKWTSKVFCDSRFDFEWPSQQTFLLPLATLDNYKRAIK